MNNLTQKYKSKSLPDGWYYVRRKEGETFLVKYVSKDGFCGFVDIQSTGEMLISYPCEVLSPAPSLESLQETCRILDLYAPKNRTAFEISRKLKGDNK